MKASTKRTGLSVLLAALVLLLVGVGGAWLAGLVVGPTALLLVVLAMVAFLGLQFVLFQALGLRSAADEDPDDAREPEEDADWRAWRG